LITAVVDRQPALGLDAAGQHVEHVAGPAERLLGAEPLAVGAEAAQVAEEHRDVALLAVAQLRVLLHQPHQPRPDHALDPGPRPGPAPRARASTPSSSSSASLPAGAAPPGPGWRRSPYSTPSSSRLTPRTGAATTAWTSNRLPPCCSSGVGMWATGRSSLRTRARMRALVPGAGERSPPGRRDGWGDHASPLRISSAAEWRRTAPSPAWTARVQKSCEPTAPCTTSTTPCSQRSQRPASTTDSVPPGTNGAAATTVFGGGSGGRWRLTRSDAVSSTRRSAKA